MDGDEDNIAGIVSFLDERDVPDSIKTVCNTAGGANISGIVSFLNDGSVPEVTLCCNEGGDEVLCNTQSVLSIVCDIDEGRGVEPMPNTQEALEIVCDMEDQRGGVSDSESKPIPNNQL